MEFSREYAKNWKGKWRGFIVNSTRNPGDQGWSWCGTNLSEKAQKIILNKAHVVILIIMIKIKLNKNAVSSTVTIALFSKRLNESSMVVDNFVH